MPGFMVIKPFGTVSPLLFNFLSLNSMSLIKNYLLSLSRNVLRDKFFSLLNLLGLAVGLTAAVLIFIYIQNQRSYDRQNENFDRIYRLESDFTINEKQDLIAITQIPLGPTLKDEFPEVEEQARIINYNILGALKEISTNRTL